MDEINARSTTISEDVENIFNNAPKKLEEAKRLYEDRNAKKKFIQDAGSYSAFGPIFKIIIFFTYFLLSPLISLSADRVNEKIPEMKTKIDKILDAPRTLNDSMKTLMDNVEALKQEISRTRDTVSKLVPNVFSDLLKKGRNFNLE